jgi:hypothetical protein
MPVLQVSAKGLFRKGPPKGNAAARDAEHEEEHEGVHGEEEPVAGAGGIYIYSDGSINRSWFAACQRR